MILGYSWDGVVVKYDINAIKKHILKIDPTKFYLLKQYYYYQETDKEKRSILRQSYRYFVLVLEVSVEVDFLFLVQDGGLRFGTLCGVGVDRDGQQQR